MYAEVDESGQRAPPVVLVSNLKLLSTKQENKLMESRSSIETTHC